jgi:alpha-D-xyloside xylohydrolase
MINPVTDYKSRSREVYLPASSNWYDFYSGELLKGGQTITANAPLDRMPVYVKEGSIIPAGPEIQYATEKSDEPITLYVFTGRDASFTLYEDENVNYNYEQGNYAMIPLHYDEAKRALTIGQRTGSFPGMAEKRKFQIIWVSASNPVGVELTGQPHALIDYSGEAVTIPGK